MSTVTKCIKKQLKKINQTSVKIINKKKTIQAGGSKIPHAKEMSYYFKIIEK